MVNIIHNGTILILQFHVQKNAGDNMRYLALAAILTSLFTASSMADDMHHQGLMIKDPIIRATAPSAGATAGYLTIHNHTKSDDRLIGIKADFARKSEIHEMKMIGDVMKMRPIEGGIMIPAGGMAQLEKGGNHLMFMGLSEQIKVNHDYEFTLIFENAGSVIVDAQTISLSGKPSKKDDHSGHKH